MAERTSTVATRTLVLCFDGTAEQYDSTNTNVVKFFSLLRKDDVDNQLVYYQAGIGTYFTPGIVSPFFEWAAQILDEAVAWYLYAHVMDGYRFLMENYRDGDKVCLFGFSRGAYTARALAGMLYKVGLLPKDNEQQIPFAYKLYKDTSSDGVELSAGFKKTYCRNVKVEFIGVWETISSVGIVMTKTLPFTDSNRAIKTFRQAISLDEHRVRFIPNLYHRPSPSATGTSGVNANATSNSQAVLAPVPGLDVIVDQPQCQTEIADSDGSPVLQLNDREKPLPPEPEPSESGDRDDATSKRKLVTLSSASEGGSKDLKKKRFSTVFKLPFKPRGRANASEAKESDSESVEKLKEIPISRKALRRHLKKVHPYQYFDNPDEGDETDVLEVWFAGCHGDIGGGDVNNDVQHSLANIPLRWMVCQVLESNTGILFEDRAFTALNIPRYPPSSAAPNSHSQPNNDSDGSPSPEGDDGGAQPDNSSMWQELDKEDALEPIHDSLVITPLWWVAEVLPMEITSQDKEGNWVTKWGIHLGKGREIPEANPKFHVTVQQRLQDPTLKYKPKAIWTPGTEVYVE